MVGVVASRWAFTAVVLLVVVQRLAELRLSRRNEERLRRRGAVEAGAGHYPLMVALHTAFLLAAPLEVWLLDRPLVPWLAGTMALLLVAATALRYWTIRTLGERWTTRIVCLPGGAVETDGPFRYLRHPNYLAVTIEMLALPLLHTAWLTAAVFGLANGALLAVRIRVEEAALAAHTSYREAFVGRPKRGGETEGRTP